MSSVDFCNFISGMSERQPSLVTQVLSPFLLLQIAMVPLLIIVHWLYNPGTPEIERQILMDSVIADPP
jgi:hypothetical protein